MKVVDILTFENCPQYLRPGTGFSCPALGPIKQVKTGGAQGKPFVSVACLCSAVCKVLLPGKYFISFLFGGSREEERLLPYEAHKYFQTSKNAKLGGKGFVGC